MKNQIILGDCLEMMSQMPDESVDLVFADPPFNIQKRYNDYKDYRADYRCWCQDWIAECFRLLKPTGSFYLMTLSRHLEWKMSLMAAHGVFINLIALRHVSACRSKRQFWHGYQPIMLYGKTTDYKFHTYAETVESGQRRWGGYSTQYKGQMKDVWNDIPRVYAGSICHQEAILQPGTNRKAHPCQMPVDLVARAIRFSTDSGDVVLDPFLGSGTTAVAAQAMGRGFIGIEIDKKYVQIAQKRLAEETMQLKIQQINQEQLNLKLYVCDTPQTNTGD